MPAPTPLPVAYPDVESAAQRLQGVAHRTPVYTSRTFNERVGAEVFFKCENFQRMGAFKFRGAYNAISRLNAEEQARGVITYSSGNHAQATALVSQLLGVQATIVMPNNAPATKRAATEGYGATVVEYDPTTAERKAIAEGLAAQHGYVIIPPFDHPHVIAGQGTTAKELLEDVGPLNTLLVCCGGGGLLSGCAVATRHLAPNCTVIGIEPELGDDATRSFHSGTLQTVHNPPTIADGARTASLGQLTWPLVRHYVDDMRTVSDDDLREMVRFAFYRMKLVIEPSGALAAAALLSGKVRAHGRVGVVISGGNLDAATMTQILGAS